MMIYNLSISDNIKKQLEGDFNATMSSIATSPPNPAWFINGEFVVTKLDRRSAQIKLGDGGYGSVLLGQFLDVGVAKKVFHKADEFDEKEVELCFELRHPNIIRLLGASAAVSDLPPALYFELVDGPSLRQVFSTSSKMSVPAELKMKISREIASGMTYLHSQNPVIIHCDLKPDNILLTSGMQVKIIDFGLSVFVKASASARQQSKVVGTEVYSSPEVLLNRKIDHKVDVWSFGMTLYELWSGVVPWREPLVTNVAEALKASQRPSLSAGAIPAELKKIIGGCWKEEGKDRSEFVSLYRELCVGEFEEMSSHLKQLSLGGSPSSSQGLFSYFFIFIFLDFNIVVN